jgi:hypothetical protein
MQTIELSGDKYPIRFDFRALKEYKAITKNDVLTGFESNTENVITLTYCALKSGHIYNKKTQFELTEDAVAGIIDVSDLNKITTLLVQQIGFNNPKEKEEQEESGETSGIA